METLLKTNNNYIKYSLFYLTIITIFFLFSSCDNFTRYREEKYQCGSNSTGIDEILLKNLSPGSEVKVIYKKHNIKSEIEASDDEKIIFNISDSKVVINRNANEIIVKSGDQLTIIHCEKSVFKM